METKPKIIFTDFDGTMTAGSELTPKFFEILALLEKHTLPLIIVTGRSKSWAHFFLTHFSQVKHVISEGGGVFSSKNSDGVHHGLEDHLLVPEQDVHRLELALEGLLNLFPDLQLSADSFGRQTDRAIELSYILANKERAQKIKDYMKGENINFSISNVHLNFWCGDISKFSAVDYYLKNHSEILADDCIYFGDALNDESMFKHFKNSVGVSNISEIIDQLNHKPTVVLEGVENSGPSGVLNHLSSLLK